jgi:hypothetical protein
MIIAEIIRCVKPAESCRMIHAGMILEFTSEGRRYSGAVSQPKMIKGLAGTCHEICVSKLI